MGGVNYIVMMPTLNLAICVCLPDREAFEQVLQPVDGWWGNNPYWLLGLGFRVDIAKGVIRE